MSFLPVADHAVSEVGSIGATPPPDLSGYGFGAIGWLGIGKEATWGTTMAAAMDGDFHAMLSENLSLARDRYEIKNQHGRYHEPDDVAGVNRITGSILASAYPLLLGRMLRGAMNTVSGSVVSSGSLWTTRFVSQREAFSTQVPLQPYSMEIFRGVNSSQMYTGCLIHRLELSVSPNNPLKVKATIIGKATENQARSNPVFVNSPREPFTWDTASVQVGGAAVDYVEALTVTIDNQLEGIPSLNNSFNIACARRKGPQLIRVAGTCRFDNITDYQDFKNDTERAFVLSLTKADSFQLVLDMPRVVYTAFPLSTSGAGRQVVSFEGIARFHVNSNLALDARLTTTNSAF